MKESASPPRAVKVTARAMAVTGAALVLLGLAMPAIAMEYIHDPTARAQQEVDRAELNLFIATINLGTKVSVYGTVQNVTNVTDLDFIPDNFPIKLAVLRLGGFDGLVIFENKIGFRNGEVAVVEGYYYAVAHNNTTYSVVTGSSLPDIAIAVATGLESGALKPAHVFRPWWDGAALTLGVTGAIVGAAGVSTEVYARRFRSANAEPPPAKAPFELPPPP